MSGLDAIRPRTFEAKERSLDRSSLNPFVRYRRLLSSWTLATSREICDEAFVEIVADLDERVAAVAGTGFVRTPLVELDASTLAKDERGNVGASHKARHLMALVIDMDVRARLGLHDRSQTLAIASCGNAARSAAILARAVERELVVFVPERADHAVVAEIRAHGAEVVTCARDDRPGDPCYRAFRDRVESGAAAFCCQGVEAPVNLEGGRTLAFEMAEQVGEAGRTLDHLFVQCGGGALAASTMLGFEEAVALGLVAGLPRFHVVQTAGCAPLDRAWRSFRELEGAPDDRCAEAAARPADFMRPWEVEPRSAASGILDDETHDWLAVCRGLATSGGDTIVVDEATVAAAHARVPGASATGTAGLAGLMSRPVEGTSGVLITG